MQTQLTIGLVVWNGARYLRQCLDSVIAQTYTDFRFIVLDNGSTDESLAIINEYALKYSDKIIVWPYTVNVGFAKGHNAIMHAAQSPFYMALNQDIVLHQDYVKFALQVISSRDDIGSVSGKILVWDFANQKFTTTVDSLGLTVKKWGQVLERGVGDVDVTHPQFVEEVFGVSGTVPIYSLKALKEVAYEQEFFDESFFSYKEDVDLAFRLRWAGYSSFVVHESIAYHDRGAKSTALMTVGEAHAYRKTKKAFINYHSYKNHLSILYKNYSWQMLLIRLPQIALYEISKFFYLLVTEFATIKSLKDFFALIPVYRAKRKKRKQTSNISYRQILRAMR